MDQSFSYVAKSHLLKHNKNPSFRETEYPFTEFMINNRRFSLIVYNNRSNGYKKNLHIMHIYWKTYIYYMCVSIQGVTGGTDQTLGECSLGQTTPI